MLLHYSDNVLPLKILGKILGIANKESNLPVETFYHEIIRTEISFWPYPSHFPSFKYISLSNDVLFENNAADLLITFDDHFI